MVEKNITEILNAIIEDLGLNIIDERIAECDRKIKELEELLENGHLSV